MATFGVAVSPSTLELADKVMEAYTREGDKKEDTLLRILKVAESQALKETHPELKGVLVGIEKTVNTLRDQINGIVAGQDLQILDIQARLDAAINEKRMALEQAKSLTDTALAKSKKAEAAIKQAADDVDRAKKTADAAIEAARREAALLVQKANMERDNALRELKDARSIAEAKTENNNLLIRRVEYMEHDVAAYKALLVEHAALQEKYNALVNASH